VALDEVAAAALDAQAGERPTSGGVLRRGASIGYGGSAGSQTPGVGYGDSGGASRFFYCAKASKAEREAGLSELPAVVGANGSGSAVFQVAARARRNTHPTVKPLALMRWLVRLAVPVGGSVLDPFTGSGTTRLAAIAEGRQFVGVELSHEYLAIAAARRATPGFAI
jgi:site-specific DNA-methyltransferase (adenine-specific)